MKQVSNYIYIDTRKKISLTNRVDSVIYFDMKRAKMYNLLFPSVLGGGGVFLCLPHVFFCLLLYEDHHCLIFHNALL